MNFEQWLSAKGINPEGLSAVVVATLQASWRAEQNPPSPPPVPNPPTPAPPVVAKSTFDEKMAAIEAENARIEYIRSATTRAMEANLGNVEKCKQLREMCDAAVLDKKVDRRDFELALTRMDRAIGPIISVPQQAMVTEEVLEAAVCMTHKLKGVERNYSDQVLQAAHTKFRGRIMLSQLLAIAAERNSGYRDSSADREAVWRAAMRPTDRDRDGGYAAFVAGGVGPSTVSVPGILSNAGNKFLAAGFLYTEQSWRRIARVKPANDYKQMTTYRLTGANKFEKVNPGGEIKHGTLGELTYTNQAGIYGKMLGLDERDIRNDDLNAFTGAADELGRGAGDSLNEVFWTEWLDDATFFPTDKSLNNYDDGATDSVLSLAGLENADNIFASQTKPDGTPLGIDPAILLVPRALRATARNLMADADTDAAKSTATNTLKNPFSGMFEVVDSKYLQSTAISGYSATGWYLLADPMNVAAIEVVFLDGVETPIIEVDDFPFNRLGLAMRGVMRWGCNKQEYRAGVKLKGAA